MARHTHSARKTSHECPQCGAKVVSTTNSSQFECTFCEAITLLVPSDPASDGQARLSRDKSVDLSKFNIQLDGEHLRIWWNWNRYAGVAALLGSLIPLCFGLTYLGPTFAILTAGSLQREHLIAALFRLIPIVAFVQLMYIGLAMLLNRTVLAIDQGVLKAAHRPLPCYFWRQLPLRKLKELRIHRVKKKRSRGEISVNSDYEYELHALTTAGRTLVLIKHEKSAAVPRAVKSVLNAHIAGKLLRQTAEVKDTADPKASQPARQETTPHKSTEKIVLICPKCGGLTPPPRKITSSQCCYCGAELDIDDEVWRSVGLHPPRRRNIEYTPVTFLLRDEGHTLTITADWNRAGAIPVLVVASSIAGLASFVFLLTLWFESWSIFELVQGGTLCAFLSSLLMGGPASWVVYLALCQLINRTKVTVTPEQIRVWNGPLPIRKTQDLSTNRIKQISVHCSAHVNMQGKSRGYDLDAISDYGATLELFVDQAELKGLRTIERAIEQRLEIADKVVAGEV